MQPHPPRSRPPRSPRRIPLRGVFLPALVLAIAALSVAATSGAPDPGGHAPVGRAPEGRAPEGRAPEGPKKSWPRAVRKAFGSIEEKACFEHVALLASDGLEGRAAGEDGGRLASEYIAMRFVENGLAPGGPRGSYFQRFPILLRKARAGELSDSNYLRLWRPGRKFDAFPLLEDLVPHPRSGEAATGGPLAYLTGEAAEGELPEDVAGHVVVLSEETLAAEFAREAAAAPEPTPAPEKSAGKEASEDGASDDGASDDGASQDGASDEEPPPPPPALRRFAEAGIRALLVVPTEGETASFPEEAWPVEPPEGVAAMPILRLTDDAALKLLRKGKSRVDKAEEGEAVRFGDHVVFLSVSRKGHPYGLGRNVIGMLPGQDEQLAEEMIVVGAHFDHVGRAPDPRLTRGTSGEIHNGADDNASGTSGLIELSRAFATSPKIDRARTMIFIAFDAEELGLVGSRHYVAHCPHDIDRTRAMLNMDMISRNGPLEMFYGKDDRFTGLNTLVEGVGDFFGIHLDRTGMEQYMARSDQAPFIERGIPAVFLYGGDHPEYHTELDDVERITPRKIQNIARFMFLCAYECANHRGDFGGK